MLAAMRAVSRAIPFIVPILVCGCGGRATLWRHAGHTIIQDETCVEFQLVQRSGPTDKAGEWSPRPCIVRRIDGRTGEILAESRTWGRPEPQPDVVFGWKGQFVLFDADRVIFRRCTDVFAADRPEEPANAAPQGASANTVTQSIAKYDLRLPGGEERLTDGWQAARVRLMRCYPSPLVGPIRADGSFIIHNVNLDRMQTTDITIRHAADEVEVFDDVLVVKQGDFLAGYSLRGERCWLVPALDGERLPAHNSPRGVGQGSNRRIDSPLFITTCGGPTARNSTVIARRASDGGLVWKRELDAATPQRALALGPYVVFIGSHERSMTVQGQPTSDYESRWWLWDRAGNEIARGAEPAWKAVYALRGGYPAICIGVAFDRGQGRLVVGAGLDAVLVHGGEVVSRLHDIPGEPLLLDGDVLVCRGEDSHFAVRIESLP